MKDNDACFASLQDSNEKIPPSQKLEHATLSCVMKCQMGVAGLADGWDPGSDMVKGHFTRAKQLQADLYNRTATQYM